jgi:predicted RND superfamily exporter protein
LNVVRIIIEKHVGLPWRNVSVIKYPCEPSTVLEFMGSQNTSSQGRLERALGWWLDLVERTPIAVLLLALLAAGVSLYYTITHLRVNTNSGDLLSEELPFRQTQKAFEKALPRKNSLSSTSWRFCSERSFRR